VAEPKSLVYLGRGRAEIAGRGRAVGQKERVQSVWL